jgi:hypothetical protein
VIKKSPSDQMLFALLLLEIYVAHLFTSQSLSRNTPQYAYLPMECVKEPTKDILIDSGQILKHLLQLFISFQPAKG